MLAKKGFLRNPHIRKRGGSCVSTRVSECSLLRERERERERGGVKEASHGKLGQIGVTAMKLCAAAAAAA